LPHARSFDRWFDVDELLTQASFVRRLASALLRDPNDVDDVVQQTWLATLQGPPREAGALRSWLGRVVRSVVRERRRSDERRARREADAADGVVAHDDPAEAFARVAALKELADAVLSLDESYRAVVVARYFDELPPAAIAKRLGVPLATIETRLRRAREQLRRRLDPGDGTVRARLVATLARVAAPPAGVALAGAAAVGGGLGAGAFFMGIKGVSAIGAALVVAAIAWFAWEKEPVELAPSREPDATADRTRAPVAASDPDSPAPEPERAAVPTRESARADAVAPPEAAAEEDLVVRVVDGATKEPVEGATVLVEAAEGDARARVRARFDDSRYLFYQFTELSSRTERLRAIEERLAAKAPRRLTDAAGEVAVPFSPALQIVARKGDRVAQRWLHTAEPSRRLVLELAPEVALRIEVVDESGRPRADVPVALVQSWTEHTGEIWRGSTRAPDGVAEVPPGPLDTHREGERQVGQRIPVFATLGFAPADGLRVELEHDAAPGTAVRLVLPAGGSLRIEARDESGGPLREEAWIGVTTPRPEIFLYEGSSELAWRKVNDGALTIDHVAPGLDLMVCLQPTNGERQPSLVRARGPERPGETATIAIAVGPRVPVLTGRIVDGDRAPIAEWQFAGTYRLVGRAQRRVFETDGAGRFRLPLLCELAEYVHPPEGDPPPRRGVTIEAAFGESLGPELAQARWRRPLADDDLEPGDHDVGDVVLAAAPIVASGVVVAPDGAPVEGARVQATIRVEVGGEERWRPVVASEPSSADGAFELRGDVAERALRVDASAPGRHVVAPVSIETGARDVRVVLEENGRIAGRLLLDPEIPLEAIGVHLDEALVVADPASKHDPFDVVRLAADGAFEADALRAGRGRLVVALRDSRSPWSRWEPLSTLDGLTVVAGESVADPRLTPIDLRGRVRCIVVRLADESATKLPRATVRYRSEPITDLERPFRVATTDESGAATLYVSGSSAELDVALDGFERLAQRGVAFDLELRLRRAVPPGSGR
jgi:RNA polymerase sigma-70 factor (ECF subfamily)